MQMITNNFKYFYTKQKNTLLYIFSILLYVPLLNKFLIKKYIELSTINLRGECSFDNTKKTILMMYEPRFRYIAAELNQKDVNIFCIKRDIFDFIFQRELRNYINSFKSFRGENALYSYRNFSTERQQYLKKCIHIAKLVRKHIPDVMAVFLPKYNDDYTLEMVGAFHQAGWQTIVYDREGTVTNWRLNEISKVVRDLAQPCDYILTYNVAHKQFFESVFNKTRLKTPEIVVMGNPNSDEWFRPLDLPDTQHTESKKILFFAFSDRTYIYDPAILQKYESIWGDLLKEVHNCLHQYLIQNRQDQILYKRGPKGDRDNWSGSDELLKLPNAKLLPNDANANNLILQSDVVITFQTTALIDAMHTNKQLIYCGWGRNYSDLYEKYLIPFEDYAEEGALLHANSPEKLLEYLSLSPNDVKINREARKEIRESFTSNPDGQVASRVVNWITNEFI
jgi:hypothetical protein